MENIKEEDFKKIIQEDENKINGKKVVEIKDQAAVRAVIKEKIDKEREKENVRKLINAELLVFDYILYGLLSEYHAKVVKAAEDCGIFKSFSKGRGRINQNTKLADSLRLDCQTSEKLEFSYYISAGYGVYRSQYLSEGSSFLMSLQFRIRQLLKPYLAQLHNAVRKGLYATNNEHKDLLVALYEVYNLCKQIDTITLCLLDKLQTQTGIKCKLMAPTNFATFYKNVSLLLEEYKTDNVSKYNQEQINDHANKIFLALTGKDVAKIIDVCLNESVTDYAYYCLANMLLHVREQGHITQDEFHGLYNLRISNKHIQSLQNELKKTRIGKDEHDVMELKEMLPNARSRVWMHKFVKLMVHGKV